MFIYLFLSHQGDPKMGTFTEASRRPDQGILDESVTHFHNFPSSPFFFRWFLPLLYPILILHPVANWSGRTKISIRFWFDRETECYGGEVSVRTLEVWYFSGATGKTRPSPLDRQQNKRTLDPNCCKDWITGNSLQLCPGKLNRFMI